MPFFMILLSFVLMVLSYAIARRKGSVQVLNWALALSLVVVLLLAIFFVVADHFSGRGVDESVIYHLSYGLAGAGFGEYTILIIVSAAAIVASVGIAAFAFNRLASRSARPSKRWMWASIASMVAAVGVSPASTDLAGLYARQWLGTSSAGFRYMDPVVKPATSPLNVVFIYLESFERTYLDDQLFPGLTPGLKKLESEATSYTNISQVYGTGWTVAGMTASQCGIPLVTASAGNEAVGNSMSGLTEFLPGARCIGDILAAHGYTLDYMGGASLDFAGKGNLYKTHGFQTVQGLRELAPKADDPSYRSPWGLHDDTIFDLAENRFDELAASAQPFGLFVLTLGTHHPRGHLSASCAGTTYGAGENPILNAVHCTDALVSAYVEKIRNGDGAENTLIVIASDHLAMPNTASGLLNEGDRKNLLLVLPPRGEPAVVTRSASTLDIAPTLLSIMGFDVAGLGLGRDLGRAAPTIVESLPEANGFLASQSDHLAGFWQFPQLDQGLSIDTSRQVAHLGGSSVKLPAMLVVEEGFDVKEVLFEFHTRKSLVDHLAAMPPSQSLVWIDSCSRVAIVDTEGRVPVSGTGICLAAGSMDSSTFHVVQLGSGASYGPETLRGWLASAADSAKRSTRLARLHRFQQFGSAQLPRIRVFPDSGLGGDVVVAVSGGPGPSFIGRPGETPTKEQALSRGLTLFGIRDGDAVKLAHYDSCNPARPVGDSAASSEPFVHHIDQAAEQGYSTYFILGHDSVRCRATRDLKRMFAGLPLEKWKDIGFRQPYLGVIAGERGGWEMLGSAGAPLAVRLTQFADANSATRSVAER